ncbi:hypothetical protein RCO28_34560 [Streptomyces sp. LHD-70]|uniref:hypothetical protein n=1 Tax=Streptomyces sp. LHD-70 TaxID=3072140 RepID=UPI00281092A5|nr:hypothetical protein [Streptomyces sp. LHD-70]MDQ8707556.1 hypothetical protein [Streptomyces sp. LHD-70]
MVLAAYADRAGRLWRIAEVCARCAAATPGCRVLDTAQPAQHTAPAGEQRATAPTAIDTGVGHEGAVALFSDQTRSPTSGASLPRARAAAPAAAGARPAKRKGPQPRIAQRIVPQDLEPDVLRLELIELGDAFRAYQQRPEPDFYCWPRSTSARRARSRCGRR